MQTQTIYYILNPKEKIYIGKTVDLEKRFRQHQKDRRCILVARSIAKYGWENHKTGILKEGLSADEANYWEKYFIAEFNTVENGLNLTYGGTGGTPSPETKKKISEKNMGKKPAVQKIIEGHMNRNPEICFKKEDYQECTKSIRQFAKKYDVDNTCLSTISNGKPTNRLQCKGWKFISNELFSSKSNEVS